MVEMILPDVEDRLSYLKVILLEVQYDIYILTTTKTTDLMKHNFDISKIAYHYKFQLDFFPFFFTLFSYFWYSALNIFRSNIF